MASERLIKARPEKGCQVSVSMVRLAQKRKEAIEAMPFFERVIFVVHFKNISLKKYRKHVTHLLVAVAALMSF